MAQRSDARDRARRYTPLLSILASLAIAVFALPSILNLPQANPNQVAEYAPVPPDDDTQAPPGGNFAGLGLGEGSTIGEDLVGSLPPPLKGAARSQFRCVIVNGVPRQTEDPLSPPCVSIFEGNNGGSTYKGVTSKEIKVVYYFACGSGQNTYAPTSRGQEQGPCGQMIDLDDPPRENDFVFTRALKRLAVYFNSRYQTYGRHIHMYAFYGNYTTAVVGPGGCQQDCRRQDAATTIEKWSPFAVMIAGGIADYMDAYTTTMAQKGILNFGGSGSRPSSFFRKYPGLLWSYSPSVDEQADMFASWLCKQVVGHPVSFSGIAGDMGKPRKFGVVFSNREGDDNFYTFVKSEAVRRMQQCGGNRPPEFGYMDQGTLGGDPATGATKATQLTQMRNQGVTTVLWIGPPNGLWTTQAAQIGYRPEWVVFGDGGMEDFVTGRYADQSVWQHSWVLSNVTLVGRQDDQLCALALREVDPSFPSTDLTWACGFYDELRQLFTGIQVAGPKITPQTVDSGFHSIPAVASTNPQVPACFYRANDYTCVKDAIPMYWDPNGQIRGWSGEGCYRVVEKGKRHLRDGWEKVNVTSKKRPNDACNGFTANSSFSPYTQTG
jgi:hypothetical protein